MKIIDKYVGMPLSVLLMFYEYTKRILIKRKKPEEFKKILLMKFFGMGSIILSIPLFNLIRENFPEAKITFLTFSQNKELSKQLNLAYRYHFLRTDTLPHFIFDVIKTLIKLRREKFDAVLDLEFFSNFSLAMSYLSGARWLTGYYVRGTARGYILDTTVYFNQLKHVTEVFAMLINGLKDGLGVNPEIKFNLENYLNISGEKESVLKKFGINRNNSPVVVLNVNASELCIERRWPAEKFVELSEYLLRTYNAKLVFIGADFDYDYVQGVVSKISNKENIFNVAGRTTLNDLINLLVASDLFISNDSGPLHLASLLGKPSVSFFGPETPKLYGPLNGRHVVLYKDVYCSPCLNVYNAKTSACNGNNICMQAIKVDEVINEIEKNFDSILRKDN
jgi:ADP-heptose:LPS heptosyltransferase